MGSLSAIDVIQLRCLSGVTQTLEFIAQHGTGRIYFHAGEIVHAETQNAQGEAAVDQIIGWRSGRVVEVPDAREPVRTITMHWQNLLLNAAHQFDEDHAGLDNNLAVGE